MKIVEEIAERYNITRVLANGVEADRDELSDDEYYDEIILEVERPENDPFAPHAIAIINRSKPHFHLYTAERYKIISGELIVIICGHANVLSPGFTETVLISPCNTHHAITLLARPAIIEVLASPRWNEEDYFVA